MYREQQTSMHRCRTENGCQFRTHAAQQEKGTTTRGGDTDRQSYSSHDAGSAAKVGALPGYRRARMLQRGARAGGIAGAPTIWERLSLTFTLPCGCVVAVQK